MTHSFQFVAYVFCVLFSLQACLAAEDPSHKAPESSSPSHSLTIPEFLHPISESLANATEEQARQWCCEDFGVSDTEVLGSWKRTYALHNAFWRYFQNEQATHLLAEHGYPLATIYQSFERDDLYFNNDDSLIGKLSSSTKDFLNNLSVIDILKLIRDVVMLNVTRGSKLISRSGHYKQLREEFYQIPGINDGGREEVPLDSMDSTLINYAEILFTRTNQLQVACYTHLLTRGNTAYILYFFDIGSFCIGLSEVQRLTIYEQAQNLYRARNGRFHSGRFQHSFPVPMFEVSNPSREGSRDSVTLNLDYSVSETLAPHETEAFVAICTQLFNQGDHIWALNLGTFYESQNYQNRRTFQFDPTFQKARRWYSEALKYPTTEPFARKKLESLNKDIGFQQMNSDNTVQKAAFSKP